jgi:PhnO protein
MMTILEEDLLDFDIFRTTFNTNLQNPDIFYFILEVNNAPVGFISLHMQYLLHHSGPTGEIQELFVIPEFRGKGIGRKLIMKAEEVASEKKCTEVEITVNAQRKNVIDFYAHCGYTPTHVKFVKRIGKRK